MLKRFCRLVLLTTLLLTAACESTRDPLAEPMQVEADYRLLFNDLLVGHALFVLQIEPDRRYRFEAFTVPAGQMERAEGHEILEVSQGVIDAGAVRPLRFDHSVMRDGQIELLQLLFDWDRQRLALQGSSGSREISLSPGTHDRLSYLLAARRLAAAGEGTLPIRIASHENSEQAVLQVIGPTPIAVPLGHYQAVGVERTGPDAQERRQLWFDPKFVPLPLRVVHLRDGSTVEMQLEGISRRPIDPR